MAVALILIAAVIAINYKPVYKVIIDGQEVGYIQDKDKFEEELKSYLDGDSSMNIAFRAIEALPQYDFKFVKDVETNEEEILSNLMGSAVTTYRTYAVTLDGTTKVSVGTIEEAEQIVSNIKEELPENSKINIGVVEQYTQDETNVETAKATLANVSVEEEASTIAQEEIQRQGATVNGITLAVKPITGSITSRYGSMSSVRSGAHTGLDIAAPKGTPIKACASGTVTYAGGSPSQSYGYHIIIDHGNGVQTLYGHCSKLYVSVGEQIQEGDVIAAVGSTGNSTGNHLHLEIIVNGKTTNPQKYVYK